MKKKKHVWRVVFLVFLATLSLYALLSYSGGKSEEIVSEMKVGAANCVSVVDSVVEPPKVDDEKADKTAGETVPAGNETDNEKTGEASTFLVKKFSRDEIQADEESGGSGEEFRARKQRLDRASQDSLSRGDITRLAPGKILTFLPSIWPVRGIITSPFGPRRSPFTGQPRFHSGLDIGAKTGTPVNATANGVVIFAGRDGGYGLSVELVHLGGIVTRYAHLSKILATPGEIVRKGEVLGLVGSTGASTGPHLHYEVILSGTATNPLRHILERQER